MLTLTLAALLVLLPDPTVTPGALRDLSTATVCATKWGTDRRHVTVAMKRHVAEAYGVAWADRNCCEFDHLVPRSLGGADSEANLYPQPWPEARLKDRLEIRLSRLVCTGAIQLAEAQYAVRTNWLAAYERYVGNLPR
jgi:hypothetical protein